MSKHISSQFNQELEGVRTLVMQMGGLVEKQMQSTLAALQSPNADPLTMVIDSDSQINDLEMKIDEECLLILARRQPAASDLRMVLAVTRITNDLERIGDEVKKVALIAHELLETKHINPNHFHDFNRMCSTALGMLRRALDAFARLEAEAILDLIHTDRQLDLDYKTHTRTLITYMMEDPRTISKTIDLMNMDKCIERVGDHAENIAEHVVYLVRGIDIRHESLEDVEAAVREER